MADFWDLVNAQLAEVPAAKGVEDVLRIFSGERNPYGDPTMSSGDGFFAGDAGELLDVLLKSGWSVVWIVADYHWVVIGPDVNYLTCVEGDLYRGNRKPMPQHAPKEDTSAATDEVPEA